MDWRFYAAGASKSSPHVLAGHSSLELLATRATTTPSLISHARANSLRRMQVIQGSSRDIES
jgi:hypothetical protein